MSGLFRAERRVGTRERLSYAHGHAAELIGETSVTVEHHCIGEDGSAIHPDDRDRVERAAKSALACPHREAGAPDALLASVHGDRQGLR
ncbi:MAG TPA: hypothetical protein VF904_15455 [Anaeromyxobacteraceae bacterium]